MESSNFVEVALSCIESPWKSCVLSDFAVFEKQNTFGNHGYPQTSSDLNLFVQNNQCGFFSVTTKFAAGSRGS